MCHNQVDQKTQATKATPTAPTATTELPPFEDAAIIASVALFHWAVCLGFFLAAVIVRLTHAAAIVSVLLFHSVAGLALGAAAMLAPALARAIRLVARVAMGLCAVARHMQLQSQVELPASNKRRTWSHTTTESAHKPASKSTTPSAISIEIQCSPETTTTRPATTHGEPEIEIDVSTDTDTDAEIETKPEHETQNQTQTVTGKASPALPATVTRGATECVLWWSSLNVSPTERSATDRARRILHDALVVFDEIDAASLEESEFDAMLDSTGAPAGEYPLVFVWTPRIQTATSTATVSMKTVTKIKTETTASTPRTPRVRCLSMAQLTTAEFYADVPLWELARVGAVSTSALFLFQDVSSRCERLHTFDAQLEALGSFVVLHDETFVEKLHAPWHVSVDMH